MLLEDFVPHGQAINTDAWETLDELKKAACLKETSVFM